MAELRSCLQAEVLANVALDRERLYPSSSGGTAQGANLSQLQKLCESREPQYDPYDRKTQPSPSMPNAQLRNPHWNSRKTSQSYGADFSSSTLVQTDDGSPKLSASHKLPETAAVTQQSIAKTLQKDTNFISANRGHINMQTTGDVSGRRKRNVANFHNIG